MSDNDDSLAMSDTMPDDQTEPKRKKTTAADDAFDAYSLADHSDGGSGE